MLADILYCNVSEYGSDFSFTRDMAKNVKIPNGYYLKDYGTSTQEDGAGWGYKDLDTTFKQPDMQTNAEYEYYPSIYKITYDLDGGTNTPENIKNSTYNVLYGPTFEEPTKEGYTFDGWYIGNQKVTGINNTDDLEVLKTLSKTEATKKFYEILDTHRTGDITVTAHWTKNSATDDSTNDTEVQDRDNPSEDESITSSSSQDSNEDVNNNASEVDVIKPKDPNE